MKQIINMILIVALLVVTCTPVLAKEKNNNETYSVAGEKLLDYLQTNNEKLLVLRSNYGYMTFVKEFRSSVLALYLLEMTDKLIDTGAEPDKEKYMEILVHIIATYDMDNASDVSEQKKSDNLKSCKDYAMDCAEMSAKAVSIMTGNNPATSELETSISTAIDGLSVLMNNTDNWIEGLSNLETIVQDYSNHDEFLRLIEENSEGNLKNAAKTLRKGMAEAIRIKLDTYSKISNENYKEYQEFFFSDVFFNVLKQTPEYESDEALKFFVDSGDKIISKVNILESSWELGKMIGTLVGDVAVGGEDLINRVLEMMAVYDISVILQDKILEVGNEFLMNYENNVKINIVENYVMFSQYLIGCRIRGEYCLYSTVANDAGLLSWFSKESAKEAEEWYNIKVERILTIQKSLLKVMEKSQEYTWIVEPTIEADDIFYLADYPDIDCPVNMLSKQASNPNAVIQRGKELGIINLEGELLTEIEYKEIANFGDNYMMVRTIPEYSEEYNTEWDIYWLNKDGEISASVGNGSLDSTVYYYYEGIRQRTGYIYGDFVQGVIPVQESQVYHLQDMGLIMKNLSGKYALEQDGNLITDFIYDECGSESEGLLAVCQNGKWGYVDEKGQIVIPIEYDASWQQYPVFNMSSSRSTSAVKEYCYAASDGYVALCQDGEWELKDITGNCIIQKGIFEAIRPVFNGRCWVKKDGKWGVIQIATESNSMQSLSEGYYRYANEQFLSDFSIQEIEGKKSAELMFWHNYGESASDEDFFFEWENNKWEYEVIGNRSGKKFLLKFDPTKNGLVIKVTCQEGIYYSWESGQESEEWINAEYIIQ